MLNGDDLPPLRHGHCLALSLLRGSPPLPGASVLSASRLAPLAPCMGSLLSSGFRAAISLSCFLHRFLCSTWNPVSAPRPAVLQGRRAKELSRLAVAPTFPRALDLPGHTCVPPCSELSRYGLARPYLDSSEHGGTLDAVGMTIRGEPAFGRADQSR